MQVEGGITTSDWAAAERAGTVPPIGVADDHYHRYEEDFDIAKELGHNAHRFSVEWARVEPEEGKFDERELQHYRDVVQALRMRGMEPFVTLWHFSLPQWFATSGSFGRPDAPAIFARYAAKIAGIFGTDVTFYLTMNEPEVWLGEHGKTPGTVPRFIARPDKFFIMSTKLRLAHRAAYAAIKAVAPHAKVGVIKHNFSFIGRGPVGKLMASAARYFWNRRLLDTLKGSYDFIGLQYYQRLYFWQSAKERKETPVSDIGWQIHPEGIYDALVELSRYNVPIYITENGIADRTDRWREGFIRRSLEAMHRAIEDGADVRGYLHWSLLDNYEFLEGYQMEFGLIHIDREHGLARVVRESAKAYATICKNNAL